MMKLRLLFPLLLLSCVLASSQATQAQTPFSTLKQDAAESAANISLSSARMLPPTLPASFEETSRRITEATALLKARSSEVSTGASSLKSVTLAALDQESSEIQLLSLSKETFLTKGASANVQTSAGHATEVWVVRANGVNTAVRILDATTGRQLVPLVVQYPIEKNGGLREVAYYTSVHPALLSSGTVKNGSGYVRTMLDRAAEGLRAAGVEIAPDIVDVAEHLCIVEHTDHKRFLAENNAALFDEIYSLYALNEPNTFRYSVSVAGAGGMVQMIPQTYQMVRERHPNVRLNPDFVGGMTDHTNALTAMLLYMQDTWSDLQRSADVRDALSTGLATEAELVAAGYNSNPARLPQYLRRGGSLWRTLIPAETQMYLQIYGSLDRAVSFTPRAARHTDALAANRQHEASETSASRFRPATSAGLYGSLTRLFPALSDGLWLNAHLLSVGLR